MKLDPVKVDHFLDFISSPSFLQDVAYGTRNLKLSTCEKIEIPSVVNTVISSPLVQLYLKYCAESAFEPMRRSTLFSIIKVSISVTIVSYGYNRTDVINYHIFSLLNSHAIFGLHTLPYLTAFLTFFVTYNNK